MTVLGKLLAKPPAVPEQAARKVSRLNFAVNNDGDYYPRLTSSFTAATKTPLEKGERRQLLVHHPSAESLDDVRLQQRQGLGRAGLRHRAPSTR